jgi:Na+/phosphate symporter
MFGMKSMSEALQKMAGPQLRHVLGTMTTNRFTGMLTGMFVTASVQSSTATTLMTVSFVNAGLLTLMQAISIILGAHIGTTVTAWIMSLGFSFNIANFVYPAFFIGIILVYLNKKRVLGEFLFGVGFLFLGLTTLKETGFSVVQDPNASASISSFFAHFSDPNFFQFPVLPGDGYGAHPLRAVVCGHHGHHDDPLLYRRAPHRPGYHARAR